MGVCVSRDETFNYDAELQRNKTIRSVEVKVDDTPDDCGPVHRHPDAVDGLVDSPFEGKDDDEACRTIWAGFKRGVSRWPNANCLGTRALNDDGSRGDYQWESYKAVHESVLAIASALQEMGLKKGDTIGVCSANRAEWSIVAMAAYSTGIVLVALYDTLGADAVEYILNHSEVKMAFVSKQKSGIVLDVLGKCKTVKTIVQFDHQQLYNNVDDKISEDQVKAAAEHDAQFVGFSTLLQKGREAQHPVGKVQPDDLAFIMYTSGTTGVPKGVQLTNGNLMACVGGAVRGGFGLQEQDEVHISYLPLAHIFETIVQVSLFAHGGAIGFFAGNVKTLVDDIKTLQPTVFCGVPRVFSRIYDKVKFALETAPGVVGALKRLLVGRALQSQSYIARRGMLESDNKYMQKVRAGIGLSRCRMIVTGAAPCPPYLMEFLRVVINPSQGVVQGYGMTETAAAVSLSQGDDHTMGHVGGPLPSAEICLQSVPEMGYLASEGKGEVLARGPSIFKGYYKNEEATKSTLENGWIHTGDIGRWNPNGTLSIIDRKKNIFKLSQGEYIASEKIEGVIKRSPLVNQVFVYGNSYKPFVLGVVVPDAAQLLIRLKQKGWWGDDSIAVGHPQFQAEFKRVVGEHEEEVRDMIMTSIRVVSEEHKLKRFEYVRDIHIEYDLDELLNGFNVERETMTPTFKLRRPFLLKRYREQIRALYTKHGNPPTADENW
eukprot:TRINITY_DN64771_c0_g1_i1.p2 TRINITY_DN64771_c0_g1~~TRINITY_DN64771_c0_g1_i1.p2  ORF type:complete len:715 (-),score=457.20 TRINITY_DN64771_c0_g1_i1:79-2223(-)